MRSTTAIVLGVVGTVATMILVLVLIVLPSADPDCGPVRYVPRPQVGNCAPTDSPAEQGLSPDAQRVLRCVHAHFGVRDFDGAHPGPGDHGTGRAVDILPPDTDTGDRIVEYLRKNALAFGIDYLIWRQRTWTPDPTGVGAGAWQQLPDRGSAAANRMDRIQVTVKAQSGPSLAAAVAPDAGPGGGVNDGGGLVPTTSRHHPMGGSFHVTDGFGARNGEHKGVDFAATEGTPIVAAADGKVVAAGPAEGFGNWIVIDSLDPDGVAFSTVYGHMSDEGVLVRIGDAVTAGQHIGNVGSAGESSGPHLHFEVVPGGRLTGGAQIDPMPWLSGAPITGPLAPAPGDAGCYNGFGTPGGNLAVGTVPRELVIWYRRAGSLCPQITPSLLAAQARQESGFQRGLTSPAGAQGLAQFMPGTAAAIDPDDGQPYVLDADGSGRPSVWDDADAIIGQGRYMCHLAKQIDTWKAQGKVTGDTPALALAAYNAGEGAVLASGGMPDLVPAHFSETQPYVRNILSMEPAFRAPGGSGEVEADGNHLEDHAGSGDVLRAGAGWLGTPYVFGGGGPQGPTGGGFDMPGLTSAAVAAATGGAVSLPRTVEEQWQTGTEIPLSRARPGDLVFGGFGVSGPSVVGIYAGDASMVIARSDGGVVRAPLTANMRVRRVE